VTTRVRADAFERALGGAPATAGGSRRAAETAQLLATVAAVRTLPREHLTPRPDFRAELHQRLLAEAQQLAPVRRAVPAPRRTVEDAPRRRHPGATRFRRAVAGTVAAVLLGGAGAAVASTAALPGDLLYPVKRSMEGVRLELSGGQAARGATELDLARTRLDEAEMLLVGPAGDGDALARTALEDFSGNADSGIALLLDDYAEGGDPQQLAAVDSFLRDALPRLQRIRLEAAPAIDALIDEVVADLRQVDSRLQQTLAACGSPCSEVLARPALLPVPRDGPGAPGSGVAADTGAAPTGSASSVAPAVPGPEVAAPTGGAVGGSPDLDVDSGAGLDLSPGGSTASAPGIGVRLPGTTASTGGLGLPGVSATVGPLTATLPSVGLDVPTTGSTCLLIICR
jgi:hypothetical protein